MAKSKKFYVVWKGVKPGIYDNWEEASLQVSGFQGAQYKSFSTKAEAESAFKKSYWTVTGNEPASAKGGPKISPENWEKAGINLDALAVDAACSGNPGPMEYRGVHIKTGQEIFRIGPFDDGTNNIGEFLALVHGLAWLKQQGSPRVPIYSDSRNAQLWIKAKACRTKLERTGRNDQIFDLIARAEAWLAKNTVTNPIIKWDTEHWGEIPADFGRK
jgi:ribonuclease HI